MSRVSLPIVPRRVISDVLTPEIEAAQRELVVAEALSWVGTPYRQMAATKGTGIDCAMLLSEVWIRAGIVEPFDPRPYNPEWYIHRSEELYLRWMETVAVEITTPPRPGDVVLFHFGRCFSHAGILVNEEQLVHSWVLEHQCTISELRNPALSLMGRGVPRPRPMKFFDVWQRLRAT